MAVDHTVGKRACHRVGRQGGADRKLPDQGEHGQQNTEEATQAYCHGTLL
jgi:hypothetical protein